jgi:hypothetical protein
MRSTGRVMSSRSFAQPGAYFELGLVLPVIDSPGPFQISRRARLRCQSRAGGDSGPMVLRGLAWMANRCYFHNRAASNSMKAY